MESKIDIVIPVKNAILSKNLSIFFTLHFLLRQKSVEIKIFIIVNSSKDKTADYIKKQFHDKRITVIESSEKGVASARNIGAELGNAPNILFIDDDMILPFNDTLKKTVLASENYDFACGALRFWTPRDWTAFIKKEDTFNSWVNILEKISFLPLGVDRDSGYMDLTHVSFIGNYGLIKREVYEKTKGFPVIYKGWGLEDTHYMYTLCLQKFDYKLLKESDIIVYHLNHEINRNISFIKNLEVFQKYQIKVGIKFNEAAFFKEFDGVVPVLRKCHN